MSCTLIAYTLFNAVVHYMEYSKALYNYFRPWDDRIRNGQFMEDLTCGSLREAIYHPIEPMSS